MYFSNSTLLFFHSSKFLTTCSAPVTRKVAKTLARGIPADPWCTGKRPRVAGSWWGWCPRVTPAPSLASPGSTTKSPRPRTGFPTLSDSQSCRRRCRRHCWRRCHDPRWNICEHCLSWSLDCYEVIRTLMNSGQRVGSLRLNFTTLI